MTASSSTAQTPVLVQAVKAIDAFTITQQSLTVKVGKSGTVPMSLSAGGIPAWTTPWCVADDSNVALALVGDFFNAEIPPTSVTVLGIVAGTTGVTCKTGSLTQSFTVTVQ